MVRKKKFIKGRKIQSSPDESASEPQDSIKAEPATAADPGVVPDAQPNKGFPIVGVGAVPQFKSGKKTPYGTVRIFVSVPKWHGHLGHVSSRAGSPCHQLTQNFLQAPPYKVFMFFDDITEQTSQRKTGKRKNETPP